MSNKLHAPVVGNVVSVLVNVGDQVSQGDALIVLESMKVQSNVLAASNGEVKKIHVLANDMVEKDQLLITLNKSSSVDTKQNSSKEKQEDFHQQALNALNSRLAKTLDDSRETATQKRHAKGYRTARENLNDLCDTGSFIEYGQLAVAAQRRRKSLDELQTETPADGIITGCAKINSDKLPAEICNSAVIINDYSVLAGTQGFYHHQKLDRILEVALRNKLPSVMYTEGGGGRPGDTDVTVVNSGLQCTSFGSWAALDGVAPRIAVANGYNFAGNAALYGLGDITIATEKSWLGMAGPAMIAGGGLGDFKPTDIGPIGVQEQNGVVDIVAKDEAHATQLAKDCLAIFQTARASNKLQNWQASEQSNIAQLLPQSRRFTYEVREVIRTLMDQDTFIELKQKFGGAIVTGFARLEGLSVGVMANDCNVLGGAIDVDAAEKCADFMRLCNQFDIPLLSLCDTPGFMVGPEHEELGAVRRVAKMFTSGAQLKVPLVAVVLRKCYGLGAQAMLGGSTYSPSFTAAWPSGEFGPMGLEGAVQLGFKKELDACNTEQERKALYNKLVEKQYQRGQATEVATTVEIDAVIDPAQTRAVLINAFDDFR